MALDDSARRDVALQVLSQIPMLWIWDNVEPVNGFPSGTESAWTAEEQKELLGFLRALRETKAKILLTSRRDEQAWIGDLPTRIAVPRMHMTESLQLVRALAPRHDRRITDVEDWRPLLSFARGNPMTLTVVAGQALREGLRTRKQIEAFVDRLCTGEADFHDEVSEGRSRSLGASLAYGFEKAFSEEERKKLALLHLFQGFVDVGALCIMGNPKASWCLLEVRGLTREEGIALLDRTADVGLLTAHGGGYYSIHPALPWFFKGLFVQCFPIEDLAAVRAFVEAMGLLGNYYHDQYGRGHRDVLPALRAEEANFLHARRWARAHGWWDPVTSAMQGLWTLYDHTSRRAEWKGLVEEIVPEFVDPESDGPLPGQEEDWSLVTGYRVQLAQEERKWAAAERLQTLRVKWDRRHAAPAIARSVGELDSGERNAIRSLAASLQQLGDIRLELGQAECVPAYEEALEHSEQIGERTGAAICAFNLGHAFRRLPTLRDLEQAESWYRRSLELCNERDRLGRGRCLGQLGQVTYNRFLETRAGGQPEEEFLKHLNKAINIYHDALNLFPGDAVNDLAVTHNQLGIIYHSAGYFDRALQHYREAVQRFEQAGALFNAAETKFNVAIMFFNAGRREEALEYAEAALRGYESYGEGAADNIARTRRLIAAICDV